MFHVRGSGFLSPAKFSISERHGDRSSSKLSKLFSQLESDGYTN